MCTITANARYCNRKEAENGWACSSHAKAMTCQDSIQMETRHREKKERKAKVYLVKSLSGSLKRLGKSLDTTKDEAQDRSQWRLLSDQCTNMHRKD